MVLLAGLLWCALGAAATTGLYVILWLRQRLLDRAWDLLADRERRELPTEAAEEGV